MIIFDFESHASKVLYNEKIQYTLFKYHGKYYYIVISPIWIKIIDLYTNGIFKYIDYKSYGPIKRVIPTKEKLLLGLNVSSYGI